MEELNFDTLNAIGDAALRTAKEKGFNTNEQGPEIDQKLLLINSEVCEAQDDLRSGYAPTDIYYEPDGKPCGFGMELADAVIRIVQLARSQGVDIGSCVKEKMAFNATRPEKHGRQF